MQPMSLKSGKVHWLYIVVPIGLVVVILLAFTGGESPTAAAGKFMNAWALGDVDTMVKKSFVEGLSDEELRAQYTKMTTKYCPYFRFDWVFTGQTLPKPDLANVSMKYIPERDSPNTYERNLGLALEKKDGVWKVDAGAIDRELVPGLPSAIYTHHSK